MPATLHLIAWESASDQLTLDSGVAVGSTLDEVRTAYPDTVVGISGVCESEFLPDGFVVTSSGFRLHAPSSAIVTWLQAGYPGSC